MKKFRSILALVLATAMLFCFLGCGKDIEENSASDSADKEKIVGLWTCKMNFSEYMADYTEVIEGFDMSGVELYFYLDFEFEADGSCTLCLDKEKTIDSIMVYVDAMVAEIIECMYQAMENEGMSREQVDDLYETSCGMTPAEYFYNGIHAQITPEILVESFEEVEPTEGFYKFKDGRLYIADTEEELKNAEEYVTYSFEGESLKIDRGNNDSLFKAFEDYDIELPLIFEKN